MDGPKLSAPPSRHRTMAEAALAALQDGILTGELAPGMPLRLEWLAHALDMSVSPIREAVRQLETLGLAEHVPHRGTRVKELELADLRDTYEVRLALEALAVSRAAERFSEDDTRTASEFLERYAEGIRREDRRDERAAHAGFHFTLYAASGSDWLVRLIRPAWENTERYRAASLGRRGTSGEVVREHERILRACRDHDSSRAADGLRRHLTKTANLIARRMGSTDLF